MFVKLPRSVLRHLLISAITKAGSERELSKLTGIPKSSIYDYKFERVHIPDSRFNLILNFLDISAKKFNPKYLPDNWGQLKGGLNCVKKKIKDGTLYGELEKARKKTKGIKAWHEYMQKNEPERYHVIQYEHFKKVGGYKFKTLRGEFVRNKLEKKIADFFHLNNIKYSYEPITKGLQGYYFPDFQINSLIIECTAWKGLTKSYSLKKKIEDLNSAGFRVYVFVPPELQHFYKAIDSYLIGSLDELATLVCPSSSVTG